jgi:hypothetical protein
LAVLGICAAVWVTYAQYGIIRPPFLEIAESAISLTEEENKESAKESLNALIDVSELRSKLVFWPTIILWFVAAFAENIREKIEGRIY